MTTTCLHCNAETSNGLVLCDLHQMKAAKALDLLPIYFRNLARWRPGRAGSRPVPGSRVLYDGEEHTGDDRIARALEQSANDINRLVERLTEDRGITVPTDDTEQEQVATHCRILAEHLTTISATTWAGVLVNKLDYHEQALRRLTEDAAPGWYAGGCKRCDGGTYVVPGLTWVTCRGCGTTTYARDHLDTILDEASDWIARPKALAEAIVALVDTEQSVPRLRDRIRQWSTRDKMHAYRTVDEDGDETGAKRYRLGDVLTLLRTEGQTRQAKNERLRA